MHMASVNPVLSCVSSSAASSSRNTERHRRGRRPAQTMRTFFSWSSSRWRCSTSRENPRMNRTSDAARRQFSVENAYADSHSTVPISMHASTQSISTASPCLWPSVRLRPRFCAQRPLPSITSAMWRGMNSGSIWREVIPLLCLFHHAQALQPSFQVVLQVRRRCAVHLG